ncbi:hypothetical protein ARMSODRAFT_1040524 [Armillaria solidipes]|uniref:Uncharacterized protein n=1 Tax=Armillaria solidipes TaxID=1076256 RepID=A0A2H3BBG8_9AGAR|nr:hypothetical protein ARMSODRAFT_1040524 [Armillaria solidipes]
MGWWWLRCRGRYRAEMAGMGMRWRHPATEASGAVAYSRVVLPHPNNGGYTTLGCVGRVGGVGEGAVGFGRGGQRRESKSSYGRNSCGIHSARGSSFDVKKGVFVVGVPIFIPPSRSTSPALLDPPSLLSFWVSPPQDNARALPRSRNPPVPIVVVLVVLDVAVLVVGLCGIRVRKRLAPMSMWTLLGQWDCEFGSVSWPLAGVYGRNRRRRAWESPGLSLEMSSYASASFEGLRGWWWGRCRLSGALGAAGCARKT